MNARRQIESLLNQASRIGLKEIEKRARKIMRAHSEIKTFILGMGTAAFYNEDGPMMEEDWPYMKNLYSFLYEYDEYLKLSGNLMRLNSWDGPVRKDW